MRLRFVVGVAVCFVAAGVLLAVVFAGPGSLQPQAPVQGVQAVQETATDTSQLNPIARENTYPGTASWQIPAGNGATTQIQAYANATSVTAGQVLTFYASTQYKGIFYSLAIYRLGWYSGLGGRLMAIQENLVGHAQGYFDSVHHKLVGCNSCYVDTKTGLVEARWQPSYSITIPPTWTTGIYLAKLTDASGKQTYVPFDVRGNLGALYAVATPDTTYQAYNLWGGYSLYAAAKNGIVPTGENESSQALKGVKVSFDRPYTGEDGSSQVLVYEADAIHWLERQGYDISYISNVDLHENPGQVLHYRAYISLGHDEYWTKEMRDGVEHARDSGVGLAFFGADASYWQMRFEADSAGRADRAIVCYKVQTSLNDLASDPLYGVDNSRVTSQWRDPVVARPENALIGVMYSGFTNQSGFPWQASPRTQSTLLQATGLTVGQQYGCGVVGNEWDRVFDNGDSPAGLQVLGNSSTINFSGNADVSNSTYYLASSGAMVFASGSIYWASALDKYRLHANQLCPRQSLVVPGMQKLMAKVMALLIVRHPSI
jgi:hypothetical protein